MDTILAITSWIALAYICRSRLKVSIFEVWTISASILIISSYLIILLIDLQSLFYFKMLLSSLALFEYYKYHNNRGAPPHGALIIVGISFILIAFLITRQESYLYLFNWDDFSHWARSVKLLVIGNGFEGFYMNHVLFPSYGPASATWHAFFQNWYVIDERILYFSQILWIFSLLLCVYGVALNYLANFFQKILILIILTGLANTITPSGHNLQVDILIGLSLASAYLVYNYSNANSSQKLIYSSLILFPVVLTKPIGIAAALQFSFLNLVSNGLKKKEIIRNFAVVFFASLGMIIWIFFIIGVDVNSSGSMIAGDEILQRITWQSKVFYDYFFAKLFYSSVVEKTHVVIYGSLLYSIVIYIDSRSIRLFKIVLLAIITYLAFLFLAYAFHFNSGNGTGEAASLDSMNRYFSVQFYFLIPIMLVEALRLHTGKVNYALFALIFLVISFYFTKVFIIFPIILAAMVIVPKYASKAIISKAIIILLIPIAVTMYYSYDLFIKKIIPSAEYIKDAKRLKEIGELLRGDDGDSDRAIVVWDGYGVDDRLGVEYYSDYQYRGYRIISTEEYNLMNTTKINKNPTFQNNVIFK